MIDESMVRSLAERDQAYPMGNTPVKFTLSQNGGELESTEEVELNFDTSFDAENLPF
ncbi:MAG: hypothetical protein ACO3VG_03360 [Nitriliruptoraceae bacterium]